MPPSGPAYAPACVWQLPPWQCTLLAKVVGGVVVDDVVALAALRRARLLFGVVHEGVGLGVRGRPDDDDAVFGNRIPQFRARVVVRRHRHVERRSLSFPAHDGHHTRVSALVRCGVRLALVILIAHVDGRGHRGPLGALRIS